MFTKRKSSTAYECITSPRGDIKHVHVARLTNVQELVQHGADLFSGGPPDKTTLESDALKQCVPFPAGYTSVLLLLD